VIIASGPSAKSVPIEKAIGHARFIAVNSSWALCPWADVLYACDYEWWKFADGCPQFKGLKISVDPRACNSTTGWDVKHVMCSKVGDQIEFNNHGRIGWGGNSGFGALNLAIQFGVKKIILVGYDMTIRHGSHWHGDHPDSLKNPSIANSGRWRRAIDEAARFIAAHRIKVINCSPISTLINYPVMTLEEALGL